MVVMAVCAVQVWGMACSGVSTLLTNLGGSSEDVTTTMPMVGLCLETVPYRGGRLSGWTVWPSTVHLRRYLVHTFMDAPALVFVVDATAPDMFARAREELEAMLTCDLLAHKPLLVLATKSDVEGGARSAAEVGAAVGVLPSVQGDPEPALVAGRPVKVQSVCGATLAGVHEALEWLAEAVAAGRGGRVAVAAGASRSLSV